AERLRRCRHGPARQVDRSDRAHLPVQECQAERRRYLRRLVPAARRRAQGALNRQAVTAFVALDDVSHVYGGAGGTLAVDGLSIRVNRGEFAAVVGPSGCGKSTLMKLATGLQFPFKGKVQVAGSLVEKPVKIAGMAFQAPTLLPWRP